MAASACATTPLCTQDIPTSAATLHLAHRLLALSLVFIAGGLAIALLRERGRARRCGVALGIVLVLQASAGASMLVFGFPLWLGLAHNLFGVLLLLAALTAIRG
jgi:cytochrome c oxidase assembly protein subunit 15